MSHWVLIGLRVSIVGLLLSLLIGEVAAVPAAGAALVQASPRLAAVEVPLVAVGEVVLLCVQIAMVCTWVLLGLVAREALFTSSHPLRWVDVIVAASLTATVLVAGVVWLSIELAPGVPVLATALGAAALFGVGFTLLVLVLRGLLRQAVRLRAELSEVV